MRTTNVLALALAMLAAYSYTASAVAAQSSGGSVDDASITSIYELAVANPERTDADRERDAARKPAEVLDFFGIRPGMTVLDMFSGGGYYTELLSYVVGPDGRVIAHTNSAYAGFVGDETVNRYADNRLPNVETLLAENNELRLRADVLDAVMLILSYHDIYWVDEANGWPKIDGPKLLAEFMKFLLVVIIMRPIFFAIRQTITVRGCSTLRSVAGQTGSSSNSANRKRQPPVRPATGTDFLRELGPVPCYVGRRSGLIGRSRGSCKDGAIGVQGNTHHGTAVHPLFRFRQHLADASAKHGLEQQPVGQGLPDQRRRQ